MKKFLYVLFLGFIGLNGYGQELKNAVKFLPVNLALNALNLEYERMLNPKNAVEFGFGIPLQDDFLSKYNQSWAEDHDITSDKLSVLLLRSAYRHYTGKSGLPKGFYLAPYLKYQSVKETMHRVGMVEEDEMIPYEKNEDYDTKITTFNAGLQLGYQFLIKNRVTLDLYFLGFEGGLAKVNSTFTTTATDQLGEAKSDIEDAINDLPLFWSDKIVVQTSGNTLKIDGNKLPYPWFRGGFSIGFAF